MGCPLRVGLWVGHQALVAKETLFPRNQGLCAAGPSEASCSCASFSNGILGGTARIPEKVEFVGEALRHWRWQNKKARADPNTTGPDVLVQGEAAGSGWSRLLLPHSPGLLAIRPSPSGWGERAIQGWEEGGQRRSGQKSQR